MGSEDEKDEGAGFVMGLLTGTVLGAGLGMLLAPKKGSELRGQLSEGATAVSRGASEGYRKAADAATTIVGKSRAVYGKGREVVGRAREAVSRGAEEVKRYGNHE